MYLKLTIFGIPPLTAIKKIEMYYKDHYKIKFEFPNEIYFPESFDIRELNGRIFDCNIYYSTLDSHEAKIKILYERTDHFYSLFPLLHEKGVEILKYLKPERDDGQLRPDLSQSNILRIEDDDGYWENGKQHITIVFDKCYLFSTTSRIIKSTYFNLSENSNWLHDVMFDFNFFGSEDPKSLSYKTRSNNILFYGDFEIEIGIHCKRYYDEEPNIWRIKRSTSIVFITEEISHDQISSLQDHIKILNLLFSFYQSQEVEYTFGDISFDNGHVSIYKTSYKKPEVDAKQTVYYIKNISLISYLNSTTYSFILNNYEDVQNIINQFVYSNSLIGQSRFMILYNCIELIRNFYISFSQKNQTGFIVSDEYKFIHGKNKSNCWIKDKIKEISEIVDPNEKSLFISEARNKVTFIRKKRITDQFKEFFKYIEMDISSYNLVFEELIGIRNQLYHGNTVSSSIDFQVINLNLYKMTVDLIIKLTTIEGTDNNA